MREVELKWPVADQAFLEGLWRLAVDVDRLSRFRALMPHLAAESDDEIRARFGPQIIGRRDRVFERNTIYRTSDGSEVRLRMTVVHQAVHGNSDRSYELTRKGPQGSDPEFSDREEETLPLGHVPGNLVEGFLRRLGWVVSDVYEDHRTDVRIVGALISLRAFPVLGTWLEIEGTRGDIRACAPIFGLSIEHGIRKGWRTLWREYCVAHPDEAYDPHQLTFSSVRFKKGGGQRS